MFTTQFFYEDEKMKVPYVPAASVTTKNSVPFAGQTIKTVDANRRVLAAAALKNEIDKRALKGRSITGKPLPTSK